MSETSTATTQTTRKGSESESKSMSSPLREWELLTGCFPEATIT